jgi:uncharacterized coiled-coil DUF342 family protein
MEKESLIASAVTALLTFLGTWGTLIRSMADGVKALTADVQKLREEVAAAQKERGELREALGALREQLDSVTSQRSQTLPDITDLKERLRELEVLSRETVTRSELADLGDSQGKTLEKLIEKLGVVTGRLDAIGLGKRS